MFDVRALGLINRYSGVEEIYFDGGAGQDRLTLINVTVPLTAFGGPDDDILVGTRNDDYLDGGAGQDLIIGRGGNDRLFGGDGNDTIWGDFAYSLTDPGWRTPGDLWGSADPDVNGTASMTRSRAVTATTTSRAAPATTRSWAGRPGHSVWESRGRPTRRRPGRDFVLGDLGNDTIRGGSGNDFISGGPGTDHLFGDGGNDLIVGGFATNTASSAIGQAEQNQLVADGFKDMVRVRPGAAADRPGQRFWDLLQAKQTFLDSRVRYSSTAPTTSTAEPATIC